MMKLTTNKKWIFIIIAFLITITAIRLLWTDFLMTFEYPQNPSAEHGVLDLREWEFSNEQTLPLNGEWEFFPSAFISPEEFEANGKLSKYKKVDLTIPNTWDEAFTNQGEHSFRFGTYRLRILLEHGNEQSFGLRINKIRNASSIYANGQLVASSGHPAKNLEDYQARDIPYTVEIEPNHNEIDLIIHVSNRTYTGDGGITEPIRFGTIDAINLRTALSIGLQLLLCIILLFHCVYAILLYFLGVKSKGLHYFSLLILCAVLSVLVSDDRLLFTWIDPGYEWSVRMIYFSYIGIAAFLPLVFKNLFLASSHQKIVRLFSVYCGLYALFILLSPYTYIESTSRVLLSSVLLLSVMISVYILSKVTMEKEDIIFLLIACLTIGTNILWGIIKNNAPLEMIHYPFDLIFAILAFSAFWFRRFFRATAETKQLTEKLQLENKRKDEFLVNTSHELRNPLHVITNMTSSILDDQNDTINHELRTRLITMNSISKRMALMLNDLIDITRLKENTIQLQLTNVNIQSIIVGVIDMVRPMLDGKPVRLLIKMPDMLPTVHADENRLIQILFNLVHNAVKYTDEGTITIRLDLHNGMVRIRVVDTGIGIEEGALQSIFQPYEQASINATRASGGFGLGLSICKQLVELHGGILTVHSTIGEGSVFTFTLPFYEDLDQVEQISPLPITSEPIEIAAATTDMSNPLSETTKTAKTKPKLLAVDDDSVNLKVLRHLLEVEGYEMTTVINADEAIATLENERYDLVISDVMMPNVSGYELTRLIRERFTISELPVLLLTARSRSEDILAGFQSGANDYVKKPIDAKELKARVRALTTLKLSIEERLHMEGAWLQSQIQPHFLYNTLNSIAALGMVDFPKMQALLEEFSNYLRLSFDFKNAEPVVPVEHELALVRSYLYIENERFGDRLKVQWEINTDIDFYLPPLSIQPLVENAVKHGILQRKRGGTVCIRIEQRTEHIEISILDDGKGMTEAELKQLFMEEERSGKRKGIGLRNIDRRLKRLYGKGLTIHSTLEQGTIVSFHIPPKNKE